MKDKSTILITILELISLICGTIALVLQLHGGVSIEKPIIWLLVFIIVSSGASLITKLKTSPKQNK